jgi:hypothetical protein
MQSLSCRKSLVRYGPVADNEKGKEEKIEENSCVGPQKAAELFSLT